MLQSFPKGTYDIAEGAVYRRGMGGALSEIAEVVEIGKDRLGIPHVRFIAHMMRGSYASQNAEQRTLALETFCARYKERLSPKEPVSRAEEPQ